MAKPLDFEKSNKRRRLLQSYDTTREQRLDAATDKWMREAVGKGRHPAPREFKEDRDHEVSGWLVTCANCGHRAEINQPLEVMQRAKLRCSKCGHARAEPQATTALPWEDEHAEA